MNPKIYKPGTVIGRRYRIDKALARGGCSTVYRGMHVDMQRPVALKLLDLPDEDLQDASWIHRFNREAQLASQLHHPNTITIYDFGRDESHDGLLYIIMEFVEGRSLRDVILKEGALDSLRSAKILVQILRSLQEAHEQGILHRDLKPSNVMLSKDSKGREIVKVLDFGLAKSLNPLDDSNALAVTQDGDFIGTPRYAPPEQLIGRELTEASDIYGVGMIAWEALVGSPAVPEVDYALCVQRHLGDEPWRLPTAIGCPPQLADIVEVSLNKDAARRFNSARTMRKALEGWIHEEERDSPSLHSNEFPYSPDDTLEAENLYHDTKEELVHLGVRRAIDEGSVDDMFADVISDASLDAYSSPQDDDGPPMALFGDTSDVFDDDDGPPMDLHGGARPAQPAADAPPKNATAVQAPQPDPPVSSAASDRPLPTLHHEPDNMRGLLLAMVLIIMVGLLIGGLMTIL